LRHARTTSVTSLSLHQLGKHFGAAVALHPTDLDVAEGELVVIVGPSGCGKSTLLRLVAGLEPPSSGRVVIDGRDVTDLAPAERGLAMVFQSYALYPHLTVAENIAFPLRIARVPRAERTARVARIAALLDLAALLDRYPRALSGGQRQRVAIGRAIIREPRLLLLDEPLSNLDAALRVQMRHSFARLHGELGTTMIHVTHDQVEAMTLANRIVVMDAGRIEQVGAPLALYARPATLKVAGAIGSPAMNLLPVTGAGGAAVLLPNGRRCATAAALPEGAAATLGIRPEHLVPTGDGPLGGTVELFERLGPLSFAHLGGEPGLPTLVAQLPGDRQVRLGERLCFAARAEDLHLFDAAGRRVAPLTPAASPQPRSPPVAPQPFTPPPSTPAT
jgi:ABC-type sugar transport system ATPase subunit